MPDVPDEGAEELYENAPCGYITTRADGTIARVNRTLLQVDRLFTGRAACAAVAFRSS